MPDKQLAHLKHRDPQAWRDMDVAARWYYDVGWHDAVAFLIVRETDGTINEETTEQQSASSAA